MESCAGASARELSVDMRTVILASLALTLSSPGQEKSALEFWNKGAEISSYTLKQSRYGEVHEGHAELIFVKEPFLISEQVKDEQGRGASTPVLKLNALRTFNTGLYSYRTMTSVFRPFDLQKFPHALKATTSVQDWCGQAFQQFNWRDTLWDFQLRSYFEQEGDREGKLSKAYLEDELFLMVRLDPQILPIGPFDIIPSGLGSRFSHRSVQVEKASGSLSSEGAMWTYTVSYKEDEPSRFLSISFDSKFPHIIRKWSERVVPGGAVTSATLKRQLKNSYYWQRNSPSDTEERRTLGLAPLPN